MVDSYRLKKFLVTVKYNKGESADRYYEWYRDNFPVPIKTESLDGKTSYEYVSIKLGRPPVEFFSQPKGYKKITMEELSEIEDSTDKENWQTENHRRGAFAPLRPLLYRDQNFYFDWPLLLNPAVFPPLFTAMISARIETAISSGVSAFIGRPIGWCILSRCSSVTPLARSIFLTAAIFEREPIMP